MKKKQLAATTLRAILSAGIVLIIGISVVIFIIANKQLQAVATTVNRASVDADASRDNLQALKAVQAELENQKATIKRTQDIVADSKSYEYQNQIIADLNNYAQQAGLAITNLNFGTTTGSDSAAAAPAPTPGASPAPAGVKSTSVSVTLANPIDYKTVLNFIRLIEQNLTKMQVSKVGLSANAEGGKVTSDVLTLEVYVK